LLVVEKHVVKLPTCRKQTFIPCYTQICIDIAKHAYNELLQDYVELFCIQALY